MNKRAHTHRRPLCICTYYSLYGSAEAEKLRYDDDVYSSRCEVAAVEMHLLPPLFSRCSSTRPYLHPPCSDKVLWRQLIHSLQHTPIATLCARCACSLAQRLRGLLALLIGFYELKCEWIAAITSADVTAAFLNNVIECLGIAVSSGVG